MKKKAFITIAILFSACHFCYGMNWTEETARQEAFKNIQYKIDVSKYPAFDPNFQEDQKAIQAGQKRVGNRFVTKNPEPPVSYVVSELSEKGRPITTMFYGGDGHLVTIRLFSSLDYPRVSYIYCVGDNVRDGNKIFRSGELMSVSFRPSENEEYYFLPNKHFSGRVKF